MKIHFIGLLILSIVVTCASVQGKTTITPDNPNLQHQGRIDFSNADTLQRH